MLAGERPGMDSFETLFRELEKSKGAVSPFVV
jgi:hypothetical protein